MRMGRVMLLALLVSAAGCGEDGIGVRGEPIRVGVITSLSGGLAAVGATLAQAAQLAERNVAAAGGLLGGRRLEFVIADDRTDPMQAQRVAEQLLDRDGVVALIGPLGSSAALAVQGLAAERRVPQVTCCATSSELTSAQSADDRYLFRTAPSDLLQATVLAREAQSAGCTRLAILHLEDSYGGPFADSIQGNFEGLGGAVVGSVGMQDGQASYREEVSAVAALDPDCVALVAFQVSGGRVLRDWASLSSTPDVLWLGTDGIKDPSFVEAAGLPTLVDGVRGTAPINEPDTLEFNSFAADYEARYLEPVAIFGGHQYDAAALVALAIESAGGTEGTAVRDALFSVSRGDRDPIFGPDELAQALVRVREGQDIDYTGASGPVDFDANGDVLSGYEIWQYIAAQDSFVRIYEVSASEL